MLSFPFKRSIKWMIVSSCMWADSFLMNSAVDLSWYNLYCSSFLRWSVVLLVQRLWAVLTSAAQPPCGFYWTGSFHLIWCHFYGQWRFSLQRSWTQHCFSSVSKENFTELSPETKQSETVSQEQRCICDDAELLNCVLWNWKRGFGGFSVVERLPAVCPQPR